MRPINALVVHCSATGPAADVGAVDIDRWHKQRGFRRIGYHYVIRRDGTVEKGRPDTEVGAHAEGYNKASIGICLVGGVDASKRMNPQDNFTPAQKDALRTLLYQLRALYPDATVLGHRDIPGVAKACPSFDVKAWWAAQS